MSKLDKATPVRDVRNEMITDENEGPMYIDPQYKKEGYHRRIVDIDRPGRVQKLMRMGYSIVEDPMIKVGANTVNSISQLDSAVRIELGTSKHRNGILMEIPDELWERNQLRKESENNEIDKTIGQTGISTQFGEVTVGEKTFK